MRILFPLDLFYPSKVGGPANTLYWLCKALVRNGHDVTVVSTQRGIDKGKVEIDKWVDVDGIATRYCGSESKISFSVIRHSIKKLKTSEVIVFSSICYLPNFFIALAAGIRKKRIVWSPRGELFDTAIGGSRGKKMYFALLRMLLGNRILFHATSEEEKSTIERYFPNSKVVIIPNYMEMPERQTVESSYGCFLYVGRIAPIKALERLVEGLSLSKLFRNSQYKFKMVGGVEKQFEEYYKGLLAQVERLGLSDKVEFVGSLTGEDKFKAYAAARYSFLVSNSENFGNVVIEALSQGTPVVASTGTPWSRLPVEEAGFWIQNTPNAIAETVDYIILQSNEEYNSYRHGALNYSKEFDVYEHVDEWEKILNQCV